MAFPTSHVNGANLRDGLHGTTINLDTDTIKAAMYTNSVGTSDKNAAEIITSSPWDANQVSSAGYTAGGATLTNPSIGTASGGKWIFDDSAATVSWSGVTLTARGVVIWDDTAGDRVLAAINFGSDQTATAGTFTITWDATNGIFYATY